LSGFLTSHRGGFDEPDGVATGPQDAEISPCIETGLPPQFPDNREFNREFFDFRPFSAILAWNLWAISMACSKIPYETEQGIFFAEQGIFWSEQGISAPPPPRSPT
jgi:hypothetical protein